MRCHLGFTPPPQNGFFSGMGHRAVPGLLSQLPARAGADLGSVCVVAVSWGGRGCLHGALTMQERRTREGNHAVRVRLWGWRSREGAAWYYVKRGYLDQLVWQNLSSRSQGPPRQRLRVLALSCPGHLPGSGWRLWSSAVPFSVDCKAGTWLSTLHTQSWCVRPDVSDREGHMACCVL